jgi:hypothetical protein
VPKRLFDEFEDGDDFAAAAVVVDDVATFFDTFPLNFVSSIGAGEKTSDASDPSESYAEKCCEKKL